MLILLLESGWFADPCTGSIQTWRRGGPDLRMRTSEGASGPLDLSPYTNATVDVLWETGPSSLDLLQLQPLSLGGFRCS